MAYGFDVQCPRCAGRQLRREFEPIANWEAFKCLDRDCSAVFALYRPVLVEVV